MNTVAVKEALLNAGSSLPSIDPSKIPMHLKLIVGSNPTETLVRFLSQLPDEVIPQIVEVAKTLVKASEQG